MSAVEDAERVRITISAPNHRQTCEQTLREGDRTLSHTPARKMGN